MEKKARLKAETLCNIRYVTNGIRFWGTLRDILTNLSDPAEFNGKLAPSDLTLRVQCLCDSDACHDIAGRSG